MKIFVKDSFNPDAVGGWFLIPFFLLSEGFIYGLAERSSYIFWIYIIMMSLTMIIVASLIGKSYIIALFSVVLVFTIINFLLLIRLDRLKFYQAVIIILVVIISFIIVLLYKKVLNYFNRPYFKLDLIKITPKIKDPRTILLIILFISSYSVIFIPLLLYYNISMGWPIAIFSFYFCVCLFVSLFSAFVVGYSRAYGYNHFIFIYLDIFLVCNR